MSDINLKNGFNDDQIIVTRDMIVKYSSRISKVLGLFRFITANLAVVYFIFTIGVLLGYFQEISDRAILTRVTNVLLPTLQYETSRAEGIYMSITYGFATILMTVVSLQVSYIYKTIKSWGTGDSPFATKHIKGLRLSTIVTTLIMFSFQPFYLLFGLLIFVFTYLMEYGNVLEQNAQNTINSHEQMILSLSEVIESKSGQTGSHVKRVSEYSKIIAEGYGLPRTEVEEIRIASMLHDIGKLLIPLEILEKPGKLTEKEFEEIKNHTKYGSDLLQNTSGSVLNKAKLIANEHHEKWNGTGYSKRKGDEISLEARIVAVADVYDALVSKRSYKEAWSAEAAKEEIEKSSGSHFDPTIVKIFNEQYSKISEVITKYADIA